ncbi:unnamed protein product, partial [Adineta steineri]
MKTSPIALQVESFIFIHTYRYAFGLGNYGLISIEPWETNKAITSVINQNVITRDLVGGEQCLSYYYYITLDDGIDYGQQVLVSIRPDNTSDNVIEIDRLSITDMKENRWNQRNITFNP